jgi:hypothetical protein
VQVVEFGVTVYVAVCGVAAELNSNWLINGWGVACALPPVIPPVTTGFVQV